MQTASQFKTSDSALQVHKILHHAQLIVLGGQTPAHAQNLSTLGCNLWSTCFGSVFVEQGGLRLDGIVRASCTHLMRSLSPRPSAFQIVALVSIVTLHGTAIGWDVPEVITSASTFRFLVAHTNALKITRSIVLDTSMVYVLQKGRCQAQLRCGHVGIIMLLC